MKKTNKKNTIKYIVDITDSFDETYVILAFTKAKLENNIVPTAEQINTMLDVWVEAIAEYTIYTLFDGGQCNCLAVINGNIVKGTATKQKTNTVKKKPGIFKRLLNWITRKNK